MHEQRSRRVLISPSPLTSSILVAEVREPPDVAEADDLPGDGQEELDLVVPVAPLMVLLLVHTGG